MVEETYSIEPGTQAESYEVTLSLVVTAVFYDEEVLKEIAEEQLYAEMGQGRQLVSTDEDGMEVSLEKFDVDLGNANLHVVLMGKVMTSRTSDALEIRRFVGMNEQEIQTLLLKEGVATSWIMCIWRSNKKDSSDYFRGFFMHILLDDQSLSTLCSVCRHEKGHQRYKAM
ncbi:MAG: hypothetical protein UX57_C0030G0002 [Candidatus Uhrbacteria bacterium GW2011_GWE2_46_68]|uniref:Uncharacterized protein n=1 Tax=Candidatus Uhrbacteria bacterium GW2011_GWE2_46_68 TaxID=1618994 RepID=A0A0G1Q539_9BACT|nr:MAG: hypothetical protein UX57_C0030G0002 [Candidatus Uhrbacteria bacterium GW2011_GWE2_46_68]